MAWLWRRAAWPKLLSLALRVGNFSPREALALRPRPLPPSRPLPPPPRCGPGAPCPAAPARRRRVIRHLLPPSLEDAGGGHGGHGTAPPRGEARACRTPGHTRTRTRTPPVQSGTHTSTCTDTGTQVHAQMQMQVQTHGCRCRCTHVTERPPAWSTLRSLHQGGPQHTHSGHRRSEAGYKAAQHCSQIPHHKHPIQTHTTH